MLAISGLRVDHAMMNLATAKAEECNVNPENLWTVMARWITEVRQDATAVEVSLLCRQDRTTVDCSRVQMRRQAAFNRQFFDLPTGISKISPPAQPIS
jgi:hypothetical protein